MPSLVEFLHNRQLGRAGGTSRRSLCSALPRTGLALRSVLPEGREGEVVLLGFNASGTALVMLDRDCIRFDSFASTTLCSAEMIKSLKHATLNGSTTDLCELDVGKKEIFVLLIKQN